MCFRFIVQYEFVGDDGVVTKTDQVLWQLPPLHAPFKNCDPHPQAKKPTRQLTVDTFGEAERPDIQNMRVVSSLLHQRLQHLCNGEEKSNFGNPPYAAPFQAQAIIPAHNPAFPPPPPMPVLQHQQSQQQYPFGAPSQPNWGNKENIPPIGELLKLFPKKGSDEWYTLAFDIAHGNSPSWFSSLKPVLIGKYPQLFRQNAQVLQQANVAPLIKLSDNTEWADKMTLKFEPNTVGEDLVLCANHSNLGFLPSFRFHFWMLKKINCLNSKSISQRWMCKPLFI